MRLMISLIALAVIASQLGCASSAPKLRPLPRCGLVANPGGSAPYLRCAMYDGQKDVSEVWRVPIADLPKVDRDGNRLHPERYICTTDQGYADAEDYARKLKRWTDQHCK